MVKNDERVARLKDSFDIFDEDGSGELSTDEVLVILTRMSGGAPLTEEDAKEFIAEVRPSARVHRPYVPYTQLLHAWP